MKYKIVILAPSAGGKSTLMRYLREHSDLNVAETDEEIMRANNGQWPEDDYKNTVLIPQTTSEIIARDSVVYLAKDIPKELLLEARANGFRVVVLRLTPEQLIERNSKRMKEEGYDSAERWFQGQLDYLNELEKDCLIDESIDGNMPTHEIADKVINLALNYHKELF